MPKEAFKTNDEKVVVGWSKAHGYVELGVSLGDNTYMTVMTLDKKGKPVYAEIFNDIFATFDDKEEFEKFLAALKRAGKQAFPKKKKA